MCVCVCVCACVRECLCVYMVTFKQNVLIAVNSHAFFRWIVNDIIDSNSSLSSVTVFFLLFYFTKVCVRRCVCVCVCVCERERETEYVCVFTR